MITDLSSAVVDGNTRYYFRLDGGDALYSAPIQVSPALAFAKVGDTVQVTYIEADGVCEVKTLQLSPAA